MIVLLDGSKWNINPGDIPTVCTWIPMDELHIEKEDYNYKITNMTNDYTIYATKIN